MGFGAVWNDVQMYLLVFVEVECRVRVDKVISPFSVNREMLWVENDRGTGQVAC